MNLTVLNGEDVQAGDQIRVTLDLVSPVAVNAVQGRVVFDRSYLTLQAIDTADSVVPLWVDLPRGDAIQTANQDGGFVFAGVIPGGITGLNGDEALSFIFHANRAGETPLIVQEAAYLLNDGSGTRVAAGTTPQSVTIGESTRETRSVESLDTNPPAPFSLERSHSPAIFDDQWFVSFATRDAETHVDHYEIAECRGDCGADPPASLAWQQAQSPYVLRDQTLGSTVYVKAIDQAGNARLATLPPAPVPVSPIEPWMIIVVVVAGAGAAFILYKRHHLGHHPMP
jgi:hypothetical protein